MLVGGIFAKVSDMRSFATKFEGRGGGVSWVTGGNICNGIVYQIICNLMVSEGYLRGF